MTKKLLTWALIMAAMFAITSCQNKTQSQDQAGQVNNFRINDQIGRASCRERV